MPLEKLHLSIELWPKTGKNVSPRGIAAGISTASTWLNQSKADLLSVCSNASSEIGIDRNDLGQTVP
jgi:hypothetical protein